MSDINEESRKLQKNFFDRVAKLQGGRFDYQIADKAGVSRPLYSMVKNGKKSLSLVTMVRIARAVGMEVSFTLR